MELNFPSNEQILKDKTLKKLLKLITKLKYEKNELKYNKYEELVRYIISMMIERKTDSLLQTTALWSLLNLLSINKEYGINIMIKSGLPTILYEVLKLDNLPQHTRTYASELISALCSSGHEKEDTVSLQGSFLKIGLGELSTDSISEHESGLASFAPYQIDEKNVELLNNLFQEDTLWKDINDTHTLGAALEQESLHESITSTTVNSSLSDFWEVMNQRYTYGNDKNIIGSRAKTSMERPTSITRKKLMTATQQSKILTTKSNSQQFNHYETQSNQFNKTITPSTGVRTTSSSYLKSRPSTNTSPTKLKKFQLPTTIKGHTISSIPPPDAIVPDYLTHLDPLSMNVTTSLKGLVQQQKLHQTKRKTKHFSNDYGVDDDTDYNDNNYDEISTIRDNHNNHNHNHNEKRNRTNSYDTDDQLTSATNDDTMTQSNTYFSKADQRFMTKAKISAEKLQDMTFMRSFFLGKATLADTHDLITRMQDILELMDKDDTGYVTWKCFSRIMLSLAPKHLLRSDVTEFLAIQVDDENDLINYKEFAITGKVLIIESKEGVKEVLARSWYARQRGNKALHEGNSSSMYSWKNHIEWYRKRKAEAVIWLMRRANRAIQYYKYVETARTYLLNIGKWGKDLSYLIECGDRALQAIDSSSSIRISLHERIIHAIKYKQKREEARRYLLAIAQSYVWEGEKEVIKPVDIPQLLKPKIFPKLSQIYKVKFLHENAIKVLFQYGKIAQQKMKFRDETFDWLKTFCGKVVKQQIVKDKIQIELEQIGERARDYCIILDKALLFLLRKSEKALNHFDRQTSSLNYLIKLGQRSIIFVEKKQKVASELYELGQTVFNKLNARENAFEYLNRRAKNGIKLLTNKKNAYWFLTGFMRKIYANEQNIKNTQLWLVNRAERAKKHTENCIRAYRRLKTLAQRSVAVTRIRSMAYADLKQIGQQALRKQFEDTWCTVAGNKERFNDEIKRIKTNDKRVQTTRNDLPDEEKWKAVLMDAFVGLATAYSKDAVINTSTPGNTISRGDTLDRPSSGKRFSPPRNRPNTAESNKSSNISDITYGLELGRLGFKKLILDGKLLGLPKGTADSCYESVDADASGCVSFQEIWTWFIYQARVRNRQRPGSINIQLEQILPAKERAITNLMKRFGK